MKLNWMFLAVVMATNGVMSFPAEAADDGLCGGSIPAKVQASVKDALHKISASPDVDDKLVYAVGRRDADGIRSLLVANGVDARDLSAITIDANGAAAGPRKLEPLTIYFALPTGTPAAPQGLVNMGRPYGWVEWGTFDPWAYFFD